MQKKVLAYIIVLLASVPCAVAQNFIFAQLTGSPVNLTGWNLQGAAKVANVTGTGNSEILLTPNFNGSSGAVFYNQPINLSLCSKWKAEFDFRLYDGTGADGLAFCFLDVPPSGFVSGGGLGIPATANGLKICFDTWNNCLPWPQYNVNVPKVEIRWGIGYGGVSGDQGECISQPTKENTDGSLSFIRSATYNHARIEYDKGDIKVYVNDVLYLTGFQQFNFAGYLGFTASTGGFNDNQSIKNVIIYTEMPPSEAGNDFTVCPNNSVQAGTANNPLYTYSWSPAAGISNTTISNPEISLDNTTGKPIKQYYYVRTSFASIQGCTSVDSVLVTINPKPATGFNVPAICLPAGDAYFKNTTSIADTAQMPFTYKWTFSDGSSYTTADVLKKYAATGTYSAKLVATTVNGCSDSITKSFTVHAVAKAAVAAASEFCMDTAMQFSASATSELPVTKWNWNFGDNTTDTLQNPLHIFDTAGTYNISLVATTQEGCPSDTAKKTIVIHPLPIADFSYAGLQCKNQTISFTNNSSPSIGTLTNYSWLFGDGASAASSNATHSYIADGTYSVQLVVKNSKGCSSKPKLQNVIIHPSPVVDFDMPPLCKQSSGTFTDKSSIKDNTENLFTYKWNFGDGATASNASPSHTYSNEGNYNVLLTVTSGMGCKDSTQKIISVSGFPVTDFKILTTNFCGNLPLLIQNKSYVQYANIERLKVYWNWPSLTDTSAYYNPVQGDTFTHIYQSFGYTPQKEFTVKAEAYSTGGCFTNQFNTTVLFASPRLMFDKIPQYCSNINTPVILTQARDTSSFPGNGFYSGAGVSNNTFTPSAAGAGLHSIVYNYTLSNGCSDSIAQLVKVGLQPSANAGPDITILTGGVTTINASASGGSALTYQWQPPTALSSTSILTPQASPLYDTYYTLTVTNEDACSSSDSVLIKVLQNPQIPNAFSPNGDGINEKWIIKYLDSYPDCVVEIFNRYGQLIFHSSGYNNPWDGTYNGKPLPVGVYYYIIDTKKITRKFSGSVTILR